MNIGKQGSDLSSSSISQYFVSAYFRSGQWADYVRSLIEIYRLRRDVMLDAPSSIDDVQLHELSIQLKNIERDGL